MQLARETLLFINFVAKFMRFFGSHNLVNVAFQADSLWGQIFFPSYTTKENWKTYESKIFILSMVAHQLLCHLYILI